MGTCRVTQNRNSNNVVSKAERIVVFAYLCVCYCTDSEFSHWAVRVRAESVTNSCRLLATVQLVVGIEKLRTELCR